MWYFVEYNGRCLKAYKRLSAAVSFVHRRGLQDDADNVLRVVDSTGEEYEPLTGAPISFTPFRSS